MSKLILFHGSPEIIQIPIYGKGKSYNDYGIGFYCTEHLELAKEWACTENTDGYANKYEMDTEGLLRLFPKNNELFPNQNFISNILFSLERLAWHEDYLVQSVTCLSALESLKYEKTNWTNTPINSMISILNPYIVQTFASLEKIKSAVQAIKLDYADICWNFCCKMLSKRCGYCRPIG